MSIKTILAKKLNDSNLSGPDRAMIQHTLIDMLPTLCVKFVSNNRTDSSQPFLDKLRLYVEENEAEDIRQDILLLDWETKCLFPSNWYSDNLKNKIITFIMQSPVKLKQEEIIKGSYTFDIDFCLGSLNFTLLEKQVWELLVLYGFGLTEIKQTFSLTRKQASLFLRNLKWWANQCLKAH
jgi:hypothetical protein